MNEDSYMSDMMSSPEMMMKYPNHGQRYAICKYMFECEKAKMSAMACTGGNTFIPSTKKPGMLINFTR